MASKLLPRYIYVEQIEVMNLAHLQDAREARSEGDRQGGRHLGADTQAR